MYHWLFLAALVTVSVAVSPDSAPVNADVEQIEQESGIHYAHPGDQNDHDHHGPDIYRDEPSAGPVILRNIRPQSGHRPDIAKQNEIIENVYNPDYYQPVWILDYRYLKTGGRDYTRGPGGQYIILPKNVRSKEHNEFKNYDELLDHLRHKSMLDRERRQKEREGDHYHGHQDPDFGRQHQKYERPGEYHHHKQHYTQTESHDHKDQHDHSHWG